MLFSIIVPVYNRPSEIDELLESLCRQNYQNFEVLIIEDGSDIPCRNIISKYAESLDIHYYYKENSGQGFSRNFGFERAIGDWLVVFDSDCIIPPSYFNSVEQYLRSKPADAWGGPDRAHPGFTTIQKAISYAMTSPFSTGGIRGGKKHLGTFHPRSFNMGISREVFEKTGGYKITRMGEDLEFSIRIINSGFKTVLIEDAFVYHKRRTRFIQFFRQLHFFGRARINIYRFYPDELKIFHAFPAAYLIGLLLLPILFLLDSPANYPLFVSYCLYSLFILFDSSIREKSIITGLYSLIAVIIQLTAYGAGFLQELFSYIRESRD